jgi:predicted ATP-dependent endonuclease of OLD family
MRIKQISVTKLFGIFDHVIPLNLDERITIIHGINGVGKTSVLKIINGIFNSKYSDIRNIPFRSFQIDFDDTNNIVVNKDDTENNQRNAIEIFLANNNNEIKEKFDFKILQVEISNFRGYSLSPLIEDFVPDIKKISPREWLYLPDGEILSLEEVLERFGHLLPIKSSVNKEPIWFKNLRESLSIRFIQSQRLLRFSEGFRSESTRNRSPQMELSVVKYSSDLAENIKSE